MKLVRLTVWSDYVCPWCYIGLSELETLKSEFELQVNWRPFLLRPEAPEEGWELPDRIKQFAADPNNPLAARARRLGLTMRHRDHVPSTRRAHQCTEYARSHGKLDAFHHHLLERYWSHGEDIHDWGTLRAIATSVGLDAEDMHAEVDAGKWAPTVETSLKEAAELGVHAVPTFLVENQFIIQGAQEAHLFRQAFGRL